MLLPFAYAAYLFPSLPYRVPTHFNASGEVDAWGHKSTIFLLPSIMGATSIFVYLILINSKKLDPKRYEQTDDGVLKNFALYTVLFLTVLSMVILYAISHVMLSLILDGSIMFPLFITWVILMVLLPSVYSYMFFKKEKAG